MPHQYQGCFDRPPFRGPDVTAGDHLGNPARPPSWANMAAAGHRCR